MSGKLKENIRILVAEDNDLQLRMIVDALEDAGFETIAAGHGTKVYREIVEKKPHLVLMDIMMPDIDGIEMCRNIKRAPVTKNCLVVIHSSKRDPEFMDMAYDIGADGYIIKTDKFDEVISRIKEILKEKAGIDV